MLARKCQEPAILDAAVLDVVDCTPTITNTVGPRHAGEDELADAAHAEVDLARKCRKPAILDAGVLGVVDCTPTITNTADAQHPCEHDPDVAARLLSFSSQSAANSRSC